MIDSQQPSTPTPEGSIALIERARRALAEARTLPDIRRVMEAARTAADHARRLAKLAEAEQIAVEVVEVANEAANDAAAVRIEAQAKAGELLEAMERRPGAKPLPTGEAGSQYRRAIHENRISERSAEKWRGIAGISSSVRQEYVERMKAQGGEITTVGLLRHAAAVAAEQQDQLIDQAENLLRPDAKQEIADKRLRLSLSTAMHELHRDLLPLDPEAIAAVLNNDRRDGVRRSINRLREWCDRMERAMDSARLEVVDGASRR